MNVQRDSYIEQATFPITIHLEATDIPDRKPRKRATGFYLSRNKRTYLITNWHVVTGKNPVTGNLLDAPFVPKSLTVREWVVKREHQIDLYKDDGSPAWLQIDEEEPFEMATQSRVDVVAIPIKMKVHPIEFEMVYNPRQELLLPNFDIVVLGYPYERERCIWKTAHVAENVQPVPKYFLINGRTKEGMSGSGVFNSGLGTHFVNQTLPTLVGIYSGRINDNQHGVNETLNDLDIGIVWKLSVLAKLLP